MQESDTKGAFIFVLTMLVFGVVLAFILSSCSTSKGISYPDQAIPELAVLPAGTSFSLLDDEGKLTTVTKLDSLTYTIKTEVAKPLVRSAQTGGSFINVQIHKDKSVTNTASEGATVNTGKYKPTDKSQTADNGAVIGKDKSDNKGAEGSGNKSVDNALPWYVWVLALLLAGGFVYLRFLNPLKR
jgi:hypothetical protein